MSAAFNQDSTESKKQVPTNSNGYDPSTFLHESDITITKELQTLLDQATITFKENQTNKTWYGRCIFLSWYCSLGDCTFCFRSTQKHQIKHAKNSRRSMGSVLLEAFSVKYSTGELNFLLVVMG